MVYGVLNFDTFQRGEREILLNYCEVLNLSTNERLFLNGGLRSIFEALTGSGIDYIYILNAPEFFGFIDYFATRNKLEYYDDLNDNTGLRKRITAEAWTVREGIGQSFSRKIWLYSRKGNTRHKRLHPVTFMNFSCMVGDLNLTELKAAFNIAKCRDNLEAFADVVVKFDMLFEEITGVPFLGEKFPAAWTIGGAARNFYLRLKYPTARAGLLKQYQITHPRDIMTEYEFREGKLLMPGLLYARTRKQLLKKNLKKYDVNSLFAATEKNLPDLSGLKEVSFADYKADNSDRYEYIFMVEGALFKAKAGMPRVFNDPFTDYNENTEYIEINEPWAVFAPFIETLKNFYDILDLNIVKIYRAYKLEDRAIKKYVDILDGKKTEARHNGNKGLSSICKFFLVNLHGKFAQKTVKEDIRYKYNSELEIAEKIESEEIIEQWDKIRFDYVRGAYIYTMARVNIMKLILRFREVLPPGETLFDHIEYDDTDSIITDLEAPADIVDPYKLGYLKLEENYTAFEVIAPKTYWGRTADNEIKLVCAGMDREEVLAQIRLEKREPWLHNFPDEILHKIFTDENRNFYMRVLTAIKGGNGYITISRRLSEKKF